MGRAVADGADVVKIFATASIREGSAQTMTDDQIPAGSNSFPAWRTTRRRPRWPPRVAHPGYFSPNRKSIVVPSFKEMRNQYVFPAV